MENTHALRSPELENVLAKFEVPKARLPAKLPSRPTESYIEDGAMNGSSNTGSAGNNNTAGNNNYLASTAGGGGHINTSHSHGGGEPHGHGGHGHGHGKGHDDDDEIEDGTWSRDFVKRESVQRIREQKKRQARASKMATDEV
jgi:hypothetical protein